MTLGLCVSTTLQTKADTITWTLGGNGAWGVDTNWTGIIEGLPYHAVPGSTDTAVIGNANVSLNFGPYDVGGLDLTNGGLSSGQLNILGNATLSGINTIDNVSRLTVGGTLYAESATLSDSNIILSAPPATLTGSLTFSSQSGSIYFIGNSAQSSSHPVYTLGSDLTLSGYLAGLGNYGGTTNGGDVASLVSAATINYNGGITTIGSPTNSTNGGITDFTNNGTISVSNSHDLSISAATFTNNGTLQGSGSSVVQINSATATNTGTISQDTGNLSIYSTNFTNSGAVQLTSGAGLIIGDLGINSFNFTNSGTFSQSGGTATLTSTKFTNAVGSAFSVTNGGTLSLAYGSFINNGTFNAGNITSGGETLSGTQAFNFNTLTGGTNYGINYVNGAILNGTVNSTLIGEKLTESLAGNVTLNGNLDFVGNSAQASSHPVYTLGSDLTLSGYIAGIGRFGGTQDATDVASLVSAASINFNTNGAPSYIGNSSQGITDFTNNGTITLSNGNNLTIASPTFTNNGTLQASGGGTVSIVKGTATNTGTITQDTGTLQIYSTNFTNSGTIQVTGTTGNYGLYTSNTNFTNTGTISQSGGTAYLDSTNFTNVAGSSFAVTNGGTLYLYGGSSFTNYGGGTFINNGMFQADNILTNSIGPILSGSQVFNFGTLTGQAYVTGAILNGTVNGSLIGEKLTDSLAGNVTFNGGYLDFVGNSAQASSHPVYTLGSDLTLSGYLVGFGNSGGTQAANDVASLVSAATINLNTNGIYTNLGNSSQGITDFTNNGTITLSNGNNLTIASPTFTNNGTLQASGGSTVQIGSATATNTGTLLASKGTSLVFTNSPTQTAGNTIVDGNLKLMGGQVFNLDGGILSGSGTISGSYGTISVNNTGGIVRPGDSPGTLTLMGNYNQGSNGTLDIGLGSASSYDVFDVSGTATLDGTLDVFLLDGYTPMIGQTFTFFDYGSLTGTFSNLISDNNGLGYSVFYGNQSATLTITAASTPEPGTWALLGGLGVSCVAFLRRRRRK